MYIIDIIRVYMILWRYYSLYIYNYLYTGVCVCHGIVWLSSDKWHPLIDRLSSLLRPIVLRFGDRLHRLPQSNVSHSLLPLSHFLLSFHPPCTYTVLHFPSSAISVWLLVSIILCSLSSFCLSACLSLSLTICLLSDICHLLWQPLCLSLSDWKESDRRCGLRMTECLGHQHRRSQMKQDG